MSELKANSVDPDQTPRSAASDLGLYCLPVSLLRDTRLKWVNVVAHLLLSVSSTCTLTKTNITISGLSCRSICD